MARGARQKDIVKQQMTYSTLSKEDQDAIANKAQYDKETGKWYVNTLNGGRMDVGDVQKQDLKNILSGNQEEDATKYAKGTYSAVEEIDKTTKLIASKLGIETYDNFMDTVNKANQQTLDGFLNNITEVGKSIAAYRDNSLKEQQRILDNLGEINTKLENAFKIIDDFRVKNEQRAEEMVAKQEKAKAAEEKTNDRKKKRGI